MAQKAVAQGLKVKPWVKTSLAPGSQVVTDYLTKAGPADATWTSSASTWSAMAAPPASATPARCRTDRARRSTSNDLVAAAVLSGNRNFEGRVHPQVRANYLASPPLVVAYALAGTVTMDLIDASRSAQDKKGKPVYLKDIWPTTEGNRADHRQCGDRRPCSAKRYGNVFDGDAQLAERSSVNGAETYSWDTASTYVAEPALLRRHDDEAGAGARTSSRRTRAGDLRRLASPPTTSRPPASSRQTRPPASTCRSIRSRSADFNTYGARRGNHEVMMRGTFANIRITQRDDRRHRRRHHADYPSTASSHVDLRRGACATRPTARRWSSSRQGIWHRLVARLGGQGHRLLGVRAVITESFERIHRSNLVGMGVLPLQFKAEGWRAGPDRRRDLHHPRAFGRKRRPPASASDLWVELFRPSDGKMARFPVRCRIDNQTRLDYFKAGGVMPYVLRNLARGTAE